MENQRQPQQLAGRFKGGCTATPLCPLMAVKREQKRTQWQTVGICAVKTPCRASRLHLAFVSLSARPYPAERHSHAHSRSVLQWRIPEYLVRHRHTPTASGALPTAHGLPSCCTEAHTLDTCPHNSLQSPLRSHVKIECEILKYIYHIYTFLSTCTLVHFLKS